MRPPEDTYLLEAALALRQRPFKLVVVEANEFKRLYRLIPGNAPAFVLARRQKNSLRLPRHSRVQRGRESMVEIVEKLPEGLLRFESECGIVSRLLCESRTGLGMAGRSPQGGMTFHWARMTIGSTDTMSMTRTTTSTTPSGEFRDAGGCRSDICAIRRNRPDWMTRTSEQLQEKCQLISKWGGQMALFLPADGSKSQNSARSKGLRPRVPLFNFRRSPPLSATLRAGQPAQWRPSECTGLGTVYANARRSNSTVAERARQGRPEHPRRESVMAVSTPGFGFDR